MEQDKDLIDSFASFLSIGKIRLVAKEKAAEEAKKDDSKCPECGFSGNKQFPNGYAKEYFQKAKPVDDGGHGGTHSIAIYDNTTGKPVLVSRRRCPKCGFKEDKLHG